MTIKEINNLIDEAQSLKQITQAFTQIASSKLKRIRTGVERNRDFFAELSNIYGILNIIAKNRKIPSPQKNGKTLVLLLTSNQRFYGKITSELVEFFIVETSKIRSDKIIIGKSGVEILRSLNFALSYQPFIMQTDFPTNPEFLQISNVVSLYTRVLVFHPKFQSVLVQKPSIADITRSEEVVSEKTKASKDLISQIDSYIIEPEVKKMIEFFDGQIKVLLLEAAFLESELARTASRLVSMDRAQTEAEKYLTTQETLLLNAQRSISNARILETIAAMRERSN